MADQKEGRVLSFPRVYRATAGWRLFSWFIASALWILSGLCASDARRQLQRVVEPTWANYTLPAIAILVLALFGAYVVFRTYRDRLTLYPDEIEVPGTVFGTRRIHRDEIAALQPLTTTRGPQQVRLKLLKGRSVIIELMFERDQALDDWMRVINPDFPFVPK